MSRQKTVNVDLERENARLTVEVSSLEYKLKDKEERVEILEKKIEELKRLDAAQLASENEFLKKKIKELEFAKENDSEKIELHTAIGKLEAVSKIQSEENEHLKKLLDTYRAMPDVEQMVKNLSGLAVPSIEELKKFISAIKDETQLTELVEVLNEMRPVLNEIRYRQNHRPDFRW